MGKFYLGHVSYKGSGYHGWQKQKDFSSVQETIFNSIRSLYEFGRIDVKATSRTDSGVHAFSQVVKMLIPRRVDAEEMRELLNGALPDDIYIHQLERINKSFKVTHLSLYKEYLYFFTMRERSPFSFVGHFITDKTVSMDLLEEGAKVFEGEHFFGRFQNKSDTKGGMNRTILSSQITPAETLFPECFSKEDEVYCFQVRGTGFLKQMVRIMMGTLSKVAVGELSLDQLSEELKEDGKHGELRPGFVAPGDGLFLYKIKYPELTIGDEKRLIEDQRNFVQKFPKLELWDEEARESFPIEIR